MIKFIEQLEGLVSSKVGIAKGIWQLFRLETRLAGLSIFPLILNIGLLAAVLFTLWLAILVFIGYAIYTVNGSILISFISVLILNLLLVLYAVRRIAKSFKQMSFSKTRAYLANNKSRDSDERKKKSISFNQANRTEN